MRTDNLERTATAFADSEGRRPANLQRSLDYIPMSLERDVERFERSTNYAKFLWDRELQRFQERQPTYLEETGRILWGKPQNIERNAIIMFF